MKQRPNKSVLYNHEPKWTNNRPGFHHYLPPPVQSWVYESDSLTQRLRESFGSAVSVRLLSQQWGRPFLSESNLLGLPQNRYCLTREVLLFVDSTPLILARTIIPAATLTGSQRILSRLGTRPLGEVIFTYPGLQRIEMDIVCVAPSSWSTEISKLVRVSGDIWGRRTVYAIKDRKMLVSEFFLPATIENG